MLDPRDPLKPDKHVIIPLQVVGGELKPFFDMPMPKLKEGAIVDLVCEEYQLEDKQLALMLNTEEVVNLLSKSTTLFAHMRQERSRQRSALQWGDLSPEVHVDSETFFIPFTIQEDLLLKLRGTRKAELQTCKCDLGDGALLPPTSINQAYTRLSEKYEPSRRSHTGNVFDKVLYMGADGKAKPLSHLRRMAESKFHAKLFTAPKAS
jgi:hypothetical protein